jgi:hypothetical protein
MLFKEIVHIYTEKHTEPINKKNSDLIVKAVGSHSSAGLYSVKRHAAIVLFN